MQTLRRGFTLIEMLVVITIIVILMTLLGAGLMRYLRSSKEIAIKGFLKSIENAVDAYESEYGHYPYFHSATWTDGDLGLVQTQNRHLYRILSGTEGEGNTGVGMNATNYLDGILSSRSKAVQGAAGEEMIVDLYGNPLIYLYDTNKLPKVGADDAVLSDSDMWALEQNVHMRTSYPRPTNAPPPIVGMRNRFELWSMGDDGAFFNLSFSEFDAVDPDQVEDDDNLIATDVGSGKRVGQ